MCPINYAIGLVSACMGILMLFSPAAAQLIDNTQCTPTPVNGGINKSYTAQIGAGRGDLNTSNSSMFLINRDPFRAIRRGRQLFQRKFQVEQGQGPRVQDGVGNINQNARLGAGLSDSCASCHGRPRGAAGFGGDVATRPDSRDAPHLFGLGLREMLADEITQDLRADRAQAIAKAKARGKKTTLPLTSKGINYGSITAYPDGKVDTSAVKGVDFDLRVRPFFAQGGTISIREFIIGAANGECGMQAVDQEMTDAASIGYRYVTPAGMVLDGLLDIIETPPAPDPSNPNLVEMPTSIVDFMEFYLLNYFSTATYQQTLQTQAGRKAFMTIGCAACHIPNLQIDHDRRVTNIDTVYDPANGIFNKLFATATPQLVVQLDDGTGFPPVKLPAGAPFLVNDIFTDFKRHDLGPNFWERNYDGSFQKEFLTRALWGVGSTAPYGHDGRSINLTEVILRHGGEAQKARNAFAGLPNVGQESVLAFLNSMVIFPPDDTASNLDPGNSSAPNFPQAGHGSIKLTVLFNDPSDPE
jgi:mono/diheme cytochrome c family protein